MTKFLATTVADKSSFLKNPDINGFFGSYGGAYVPELLHANVAELETNYLQIIQSEKFKTDFDLLLKDFAGRPTPLFLANAYSKKHNAKIYFKREDLCHTGAHKINNAIGQILVAKHLGKHKIIAETGAGQHGVATATVCALMNMPCIIYMGEKDIERQAPNVARMKMLGATVVPATSGSKTLKDATNEAIRHWINNPNDTHYIIGSVVGPHPYPDMVARFQSVISAEIKWQLQQKENTTLPTHVLACVGGGSNAAGAFYNFIDEPAVQLIAVEPGGEGIDTPKTAATMQLGKPGIIHGSMTYLMQNADGQIQEPHSISAGLDYPGIGPIFPHLKETNRVHFGHITDAEALEAALECSKIEGIIPALETAHALAYLNKMTFKNTDIVIVNISGRGDKDLATYQKYLNLI
jgi:tryptophan synthase beta chain